MDEDCQLNVEPFFQCCCKCIYLRPVHHHCTTSPELRESSGGCCCGVQKGWACCVIMDGEDHERIHDNWPQHSCGCEMYTADKAQKILDDEAHYRQQILEI